MRSRAQRPANHGKSHSYVNGCAVEPSWPDPCIFLPWDQPPRGFGGCHPRICSNHELHRDGEFERCRIHLVGTVNEVEGMQNRIATTAFTGAERRRRVRRIHADRRAAIRYEPDKPDRRQGSGRRQDDKLWDMIRSKF